MLIAENADIVSYSDSSSEAEIIVALAFFACDFDFFFPVRSRRFMGSVSWSKEPHDKREPH
jgi:hypothetical protein